MSKRTCTSEFAYRYILFHDYSTDCSPMELWDLPTNGFSFLPDVSALDDAAEYPSCDDGSVGSAVLEQTTLTICFYVWKQVPNSCYFISMSKIHFILEEARTLCHLK